MTITTTGTTIAYDGNDATTVFPYPFRILTASDLLVILTDANGSDTVLTQTTHYTLSGVDNQAGGSVTMLAAPATGETLTLRRVMGATQAVDLRNQGTIHAEVVETALDRLTLLTQQCLGPGATGQFDADAHRITDLAQGVGATDAVTKAQMDAALEGVVAGTYDPVTATGTTTPRTLHDRFGERKNLADFGADLTGATAADTAMASAIAAAGAGGEVVIPPGAILRSEVPILANVARQRWTFGAGSMIVKAHTGNGIVISASAFEAHHLHVEAATTESATYAQGRGVYYSGSGTDDSTLIRPVILNIDVCLEWAADAGKRCNLVVPHFEPYTTTAGSEGAILKTNADTGAMQREVVGINGSGVVDVSGALGMSFSGGSIRRPVDSSASFAVRWMGTLFGSLGTPITVNGTTCVLDGVRVAGNLTLSSTFTGKCDIILTDGVFTNNSNANTSRVYVRPLAENYELLGRHRLMTGSTSPSLIRTARRVSPGDAAYTFTPVDGVNQITYSAPITADRTVTLSATNALDGCSGRVTRKSTATGAFNVSVGGLKNLAAGEWADFQYDNFGGYEITAFGSGA